MRVVLSCIKFSRACTRVCEEQDFRNFDSIADGHVFIIVFEASNQIINIRNNLHKDGIEHN